MGLSINHNNKFYGYSPNVSGIPKLRNIVISSNFNDYTTRKNLLSQNLFLKTIKLNVLKEYLIIPLTFQNLDNYYVN